MSYRYSALRMLYSTPYRRMPTRFRSRKSTDRQGKAARECLQTVFDSLFTMLEHLATEMGTSDAAGKAMTVTICVHIHQLTSCLQCSRLLQQTALREPLQLLANEGIPSSGAEGLIGFHSLLHQGSQLTNGVCSVQQLRELLLEIILQPNGAMRGRGDQPRGR